MASKSLKVIESQREGAEIYHGAAVCKQKFEEILCRFHIPKAIIPLNNLVEFGFNPTTGFIWLIYANRFEHYQHAIKITGKYEQEVTAFIEERRMKKMTGIKSKELICVPISSLCVDDDDDSSNIDPPQITFYGPIGLSKRFPAAWFETAEP